MKSNKCSIFFISIIKSLKNLQQFNQIILIVEQNMIVIRNPKTFCFNFDWLKDVDENFKYEIEFIKNETEQLLLKYKHGNNIDEHGKEQNE